VVVAHDHERSEFGNRQPGLALERIIANSQAAESGLGSDGKNQAWVGQREKIENTSHPLHGVFRRNAVGQSEGFLKVGSVLGGFQRGAQALVQNEIVGR